MSLSLLKKTALLMGDLQQKEVHKKTAAKKLNKVKLIGRSSTEKKTREAVNGIRKVRQTNNVKANVEKIKRFSAKVDGYSKKVLSNDLVRERLFKGNKDFISLNDPEAGNERGSVFTDEDFQRFEEEYNIQFVKRAKERDEFRKMLPSAPADKAVPSKYRR